MFSTRSPDPFVERDGLGRKSRELLRDRGVVECDPPGRGGQGGLVLGEGQAERRAGVDRHVLDPVGGIVRVDGHEGGTGLRDRPGGEHRVDRPGDRERDDVSGPTPRPIRYRASREDASSSSA
ncbi:hypothetical protein NJ76_11770 [Rhodococcus sp. IITR03]|nr:hypothetical protein NJ76_11770 [Rhodococcus sp. IITR03]